jgi:hypothetical protein
MADGFLGRWSKRKLDVQEGRPVEAEPEVPAAPSLQPSRASGSGSEEITAEVAPEPPPLTLDDVKALTGESDFARFVAPDVAPEVKNAAMKKLFADPRYNVMDGMDVYVDDYSQPDPIPREMLRKLVSAGFLKLFEEEEREEAEAAARIGRDDADNPMTQSVAQSMPQTPAVPEFPTHADPDLRLQQDDAPPGENPGRGDR